MNDALQQKVIWTNTTSSIRLAKAMLTNLIRARIKSESKLDITIGMDDLFGRT